MKLKGGILEKDYTNIHNWLRSNYGNAFKCENDNGQHKSNNFQWSKKKDFQYEKVRDNFQMLCVSCYAIYDMTDNKRRLISENRKGSKNPKWAAFLKARKGIPLTETHKQRIGQKVKGENNGTAKLNETQVSVICHAMNYGASAHKLAPMFNISFSKICQIFRGEVWTHINAPRKLNP